jgi:hypothetical protein
MIPQIPLTVPTKPLYIVAGLDGIPDVSRTHITSIDRTNWNILGERRIVSTDIPSGLFLDNSIWLTFSGDINTDKYIVSHISADLAFQTDYITCMEPRAIHAYRDTLLVLCQDRGFVTVAMVISRSNGNVIASRDLTTEHGDMFFDMSFLIGDELVVEGGTFQEVAQRTEFHVLDPTTLELKRKLSVNGEITFTEAITDNDTVYLLNGASHIDEQEGRAVVDVYTYRAGDTSFTPLAPIARAPQHGVIHDGYLYTIHNTWPFIPETETPVVTIYQTNLTTWEQTHWEYDYDTHDTSGDMAVIDGHIMLTRFWSDDSADDGLYELDPTTGALTQRASIPGASLIIDSVAQ